MVKKKLTGHDFILSPRHTHVVSGMLIMSTFIIIIIIIFRHVNFNQLARFVVIICPLAPAALPETHVWPGLFTHQ